MCSLKVYHCSMKLITSTGTTVVPVACSLLGDSTCEAGTLVCTCAGICSATRAAAHDHSKTHRGTGHILLTIHWQNLAAKQHQQRTQRHCTVCTNSPLMRATHYTRTLNYIHIPQLGESLAAAQTARPAWCTTCGDNSSVIRTLVNSAPSLLRKLQLLL